MKILTDLLKQGRSPYQVVVYGKKYLQDHGFTELHMCEPFDIIPGGKYYVSPYSSMLFAFTLGEKIKKAKIAMAHTDFPCFKVKSHPEYITKEYLQANVEPYGGMIKSSWFDRPLGLAGKVVLASEQAYEPEVVLFDSRRALFVIPSLAPHMDRDLNGKHDYDMQRELQPVMGMIEEHMNKDGYLLQYLASELDVDASEILSYDLFLYNCDEPEHVGLNDTLLSAPRIDNLASVSALLESMAEADDNSSIQIAAMFDNEEVGSKSKQGADSMLLPMLMEKIADAIGYDTIRIQEWTARGFMMSVDGAHALHPNYMTKSDVTNEVFLGKGPVIKTSASQRYLSDSEGTAIVQQLCNKCGIDYQLQVNRSGMAGGQTLGPIASSYLPMQGADLGIPMLAMHSARELASDRDYEQLVTLLKEFFHN